MRTSDRKLNPLLRKQFVRTLTQLFCDLNKFDEVETFLHDFFTDAELETFSKRFAIAYWLKKGRSYSNIKQNIKVSSATVAEISVQTQKKGFKLALKKVEAEEWANKWLGRFQKVMGKHRQLSA